MPRISGWRRVSDSIVDQLVSRLPSLTRMISYGAPAARATGTSRSMSAGSVAAPLYTGITTVSDWDTVVNGSTRRRDYTWCNALAALHCLDLVQRLSGVALSRSRATP